MKVISTISELQQELSAQRKAGKSVGFVPTMGALHQGHASLVKRSVAENDVTVVSVFVNPTQFNDKNDLKNYPRDLQADCALLEAIGADICIILLSRCNIRRVYGETSSINNFRWLWIK